MKFKNPLSYLPNSAISLPVLLVVALTWSWLFTVRIADLSSSLIAGYLSMLTGFVVIVGITTAVFALTVQHFLNEYVRRRSLTPWFLVKLFLMWAAVEWLVSIVVAAVWIGRNGSLDTVLPFGSLTPLLMYTPFGFLARLVGYHGLSALAVVLVFVVAGKKLRRYAPVVLGLVLVATGVAWLAYRQPDGPSVQAVIVAEELDTKSPPIQTDADLIVFPEYGLDFIGSGNAPERIKPKNKEVFFVGSQKRFDGVGAQNVLTFGSTGQGFIEERPKSRLIPGGEYLPYAVELPLKFFRQHSTLAQFQMADAISKGPYNSRPLRANPDLAVGSAVCASIISPEDYRDFAGNGATLFTNSASLSLFNSPLFSFQHRGLARFMATANARGFLQSSNTADAFALDHNGRLLKRTAAVSTAEVSIRTNHKKTPYTYLGEWPVFAGLAILLLHFTKHIKARQRKKPNVLKKIR